MMELLQWVTILATVCLASCHSQDSSRPTLDRRNIYVGVECEEGEYFEGPLCHTFYRCATGRTLQKMLVLFSCGPNTMFDLTRAVCVHTSPSICPSAYLLPFGPEDGNALPGKPILSTLGPQIIVSPIPERPGNGVSLLPAPIPERPEIGVSPLPAPLPERPGTGVSLLPFPIPERPGTGVSPVPAPSPERPGTGISPVPAPLPERPGTGVSPVPAPLPERPGTGVSLLPFPIPGKPDLTKPQIVPPPSGPNGIISPEVLPFPLPEQPLRPEAFESTSSSPLGSAIPLPGILAGPPAVQPPDVPDFPGPPGNFTKPTFPSESNDGSTIPIITLPLLDVDGDNQGSASSECPQFRLDSQSIVNCTREGRWEHPGDCDRFYQCIHTMDCIIKGFLFRCPQNFRFSNRDRKCERVSSPAPCRKSADDSGQGLFVYPVIQLEADSIKDFESASVYWDFMPFLPNEEQRILPPSDRTPQ